MADFHFNPSRFFQHTTQYASQGRGQFVLKRLPKLLSTTDEESLIKDSVSDFQDALKLGEKLLSQGILASQFTIPSLSLSTFEGFSYTGPTKKMAYGQAFQDFDVTFLLMGEDIKTAQSLYYTLVSWQKLIAGPTSSKVINNFALQYPITSDNDAFTVEYYDNYITDASMYVYSPTYDTNVTNPVSLVLKVNYTEVYPITINPLQLSWENPDAPLSLSVTFAFHYADVELNPAADAILI